MGTENHSLKVLTYNTHLFEGSTAAIYEKSLIFDDGKRADCIIDRLRDLSADVVALQEVWGIGMQEKFVNKLKDVYSNSLHGPTPKPIHPWIFWVKRNSPGLILFSKHPLINGSNFSKYPRNPITIIPWKIAKEIRDDPEKAADKGVWVAKVVLNDRKQFRIGITHCQTDIGSNGHDAPNIKQLFSTTLLEPSGQSSEHAIIMGDFNLHQHGDEHAGKRQVLNSVSTKYKTIDAYLAVPPDRRYGENTINILNNRLHQHFSHGWEKNKDNEQWLETNRDRIDYVFVKKGGSKWTLVPQKASVLEDWKYESPSGLMDLSDHYPLLVEFSLDQA